MTKVNCQVPGQHADAVFVINKASKLVLILYSYICTVKTIQIPSTNAREENIDFLLKGQVGECSLELTRELAFYSQFS